MTTPNGRARIPGFVFVPTPVIQGVNTFSPGERSLLTASTGAGHIYKWNKNGSEIIGSNGHTFSNTGEGSYTVSITSDSCVVTSEPFIVRSLQSIAYPNPFDDIVTLNIGNRKNTGIEIRNLNGKIVFTKTYAEITDKISLNLSHLDSGMYLVKVSGDSLETVYKILKK